MMGHWSRCIFFASLCFAALIIYAICHGCMPPVVTLPRMIDTAFGAVLHRRLAVNIVRFVEILQLLKARKCTLLYKISHKSTRKLRIYPYPCIVIVVH